MVFSQRRYREATANFTGYSTGQRLGLGMSKAELMAYRAFLKIWRLRFRKRAQDISDQTNPLFAVPAELNDDRVRNCRVFANRRSMLLSLQKNKTWAEVGTYEGAFALEIHNICSPCELHLIDMDFSRVYAKNYVQESNIIKFHKGDSASTLGKFPDGYFDYIYIDADHGLLGVARDVDAAKTKLKSQGLLIFNDYIFFSHVDLMPYGVVPVVNSLCAEDGWEIVAFALHFKMYCDVALRKRD